MSKSLLLCKNTQFNIKQDTHKHKACHKTLALRQVFHANIFKSGCFHHHRHHYYIWWWLEGTISGWPWTQDPSASIGINGLHHRHLSCSPTLENYFYVYWLVFCLQVYLCTRLVCLGPLQTSRGCQIPRVPHSWDLPSGFWELILGSLKSTRCSQLHLLFKKKNSSVDKVSPG